MASIVVTNLPLCSQCHSHPVHCSTKLQKIMISHLCSRCYSANSAMKKASQANFVATAPIPHLCTVTGCTSIAHFNTRSRSFSHLCSAHFKENPRKRAPTTARQGEWMCAIATCYGKAERYDATTAHGRKTVHWLLCKSF